MNLCRFSRLRHLLIFFVITGGSYTLGMAAQDDDCVRLTRLRGDHLTTHLSEREKMLTLVKTSELNPARLLRRGEQAGGLEDELRAWWAQAIMQGGIAHQEQVLRAALRLTQEGLLQPGEFSSFILRWMILKEFPYAKIEYHALLDAKGKLTEHGKKYFFGLWAEGNPFLFGGRDRKPSDAEITRFEALAQSLPPAEQYLMTFRIDHIEIPTVKPIRVGELPEDLKRPFNEISSFLKVGVEKQKAFIQIIETDPSDTKDRVKLFPKEIRPRISEFLVALNRYLFTNRPEPDIQKHLVLEELRSIAEAYRDAEEDYRREGHFDYDENPFESMMAALHSDLANKKVLPDGSMEKTETVIALSSLGAYQAALWVYSGNERQGIRLYASLGMASRETRLIDLMHRRVDIVLPFPDLRMFINADGEYKGLVGSYLKQIERAMKISTGKIPDFVFAILPRAYHVLDLFAIELKRKSNLAVLDKMSDVEGSQVSLLNLEVGSPDMSSQHEWVKSLMHEPRVFAKNNCEVTGITALGWLVIDMAKNRQFYEQRGINLDTLIPELGPNAVEIFEGVLNDNYSKLTSIWEIYRLLDNTYIPSPQGH
jgi:hypothetical protein